MTEPQQTDLVTEAREYADGQLLIPTAAELDRMRELLRQLCDEVERLRAQLNDPCLVAGYHVCGGKHDLSQSGKVDHD